MMKFLTAFFIVLYLWRVFSQHYMVRQAGKSLFEGVRYNDMGKEVTKKLKEGDGNATLYLFFGFHSLVITGLELFYLIFAIQYADIKIWIYYALFWIGIFLIGIVNNKRKAIRNNIMSGQWRYSIKKLVIYLIDLIFFVYMMFQMFT